MATVSRTVHLLIIPVLMVTFGSSPVRGHADYEVPAATILDVHGIELTIVKHYTDGVIAADPVKVVVYDPDGEIVAETPYYRAAIVERMTPEMARVHTVDFGALWFGPTWIVDGRSLVPSHSLGNHLRSIMFILGAHWPGYGLSALLLVGAGLATIRRMRRSDSSAGCLSVNMMIISIPWLLLLSLYGRSSILFILLVSILAILPWVRSKREGLAALGLFVAAFLFFLALYIIGWIV